MYCNPATIDDKIKASKHHPHCGNNRDISPNCMVDLQKLNAATMREMHHSPSPFNEVSISWEYMRETLLDAWNGYHSLPLFPAAHDTTTIITKWGRYWYLLAWHGQKNLLYRWQHILEWLNRNSILAYDRAHPPLQQNGIIFNLEKFHFAEEKMEFARFRITKDGIKPMKKKMTEAIW